MDMILAGALSGAGNAGTGALQQVGQFAGQSFIEQERNKWETARLQLHDQYARERQQAEFANDQGLLATREKGEESRLSKKIAADESNTSRQITSTQTQKALDRKSTEDSHALDLASRERIEQQKNAIAEKELAMNAEYHKARADYWSSAAALGKTGSRESADDKKQKEYLESVTKTRLENLYKLLELAGPEEKDAIREEIDQVTAEGRRVANVGAPEGPAPGRIKDPYRKLLNPAGTGGR